MPKVVRAACLRKDFLHLGDERRAGHELLEVRERALRVAPGGRAVLEQPEELCGLGFRLDWEA